MSGVWNRIVREVTSGKFTKVFSGGGVVGESGVNDIREIPQPFMVFIYYYLRKPLIFLFVKTNPLITRSVVLLFGSIHIVLTGGGYPKILFAIIKTIHIFVIQLTTRTNIHHYEFVHSNYMAYLWFKSVCGRSGIHRRSVFSVLNTPLMLADHIKIFIINHCQKTLFFSIVGYHNLFHFASPLSLKKNAFHPVTCETRGRNTRTKGNWIFQVKSHLNTSNVYNKPTLCFCQ